jgi:SAM-dependent methyltransferase
MQAKEYDRLYVAEERLWWFRALHKFLFQLLPPHHGRQATVLDIGCGTGGLLRKLDKAGYKSVGLDYSLHALRLARQAGKRELVCASANALPFRGRFDMVVSVDVLEVATAEPKAVVHSAQLALRPGGHGLFVMAAHQWLLSEHDRAVNSVRRYNLRQFRELFRNGTVEIIRSTYLFFLLFPIVAVRKLLNPKRQGSTESDVSVPAPVINQPLYFVCWLEAQVLKLLNMPIGSSVAILVKKNG